MVLAKFVVKPSNEEDEGIAFDTADMKITTAPVTLAQKDIKVKVDGVDLVADDNFTFDGTNLKLKDLNETLDKAGVVVEVSLKGDITKGGPYGDYILDLSKVNTTSVTKSFKRLVLPALVKVSSQENLGDETKYTFSVQKENNNYTVEYFGMFAPTLANPLVVGMDEISNGDTDVSANADNVTYIEEMCYEVFDEAGVSIWDDCISKSAYKDYFRVDSGYAKVFKSSNN